MRHLLKNAWQKCLGLEWADDGIAGPAVSVNDDHRSATGMCGAANLAAHGLKLICRRVIGCYFHVTGISHGICRIKSDAP